MGLGVRKGIVQERWRERDTHTERGTLTQRLAGEMERERDTQRETHSQRDLAGEMERERHTET